jgi:hypothetical protein
VLDGINLSLLIANQLYRNTQEAVLSLVVRISPDANMSAPYFSRVFSSFSAAAPKLRLFLGIRTPK